MLKAAKSNNIAVVPVTETLPAGKNYLAWMGDNLSAIQKRWDSSLSGDPTPRESSPRTGPGL